MSVCVEVLFQTRVILEGPQQVRICRLQGAPRGSRCRMLRFCQIDMLRPTGSGSFLFSSPAASSSVMKNHAVCSVSSSGCTETSSFAAPPVQTTQKVRRFIGAACYTASFSTMSPCVSWPARCSEPKTCVLQRYLVDDNQKTDTIPTVRCQCFVRSYTTSRDVVDGSISSSFLMLSL